MNIRKIVISLLIGAMLLPVAITLATLAQLLGAMGDGNAQVVLHVIALALGFVWVLDLVALVLAVAVLQFLPPEPPPSDESS